MFYIDSVKKEEWRGIENWTKETFQVKASKKYFEWGYSKDNLCDYEKDDTVCIDNIVFPVE